MRTKADLITELTYNLQESMGDLQRSINGLRETIDDLEAVLDNLGELDVLKARLEEINK